MTVAALAAGLACSRPNPAYHRDTLDDGSSQLDGAPADRPASDLSAPAPPARWPAATIIANHVLDALVMICGTPTATP